MQRSTATEAPICGAAVSRWRLSGDHAWVQRDGSSSLALAELEDAAVHDQAPSSFDSTDKAAVRSRFCPNWADTVLAVLARHLPDREIRVMGSRVTGRVALLGSRPRGHG